MLNLVSDSSCDLISGELNSPYARLTVAPMCLHVGGQDYLDTPLSFPAPITPPWLQEIWFWRSTRKKRSLCWIPVPPPAL